MKIILIRIFAVLFLGIMASGCGQSKDERRQQEIEDSLQLEKDRRELLERANQMFDSKEETDSEDTSSAGEEN
jgi:hypothetical protein